MRGDSDFDEIKRTLRQRDLLVDISFGHRAHLKDTRVYGIRMPGTVSFLVPLDFLSLFTSITNASSGEICFVTGWLIIDYSLLSALGGTI